MDLIKIILLWFRQQIKDALLQQTELQFRQYAKQQFPDSVKQVTQLFSPLNCIVH